MLAKNNEINLVPESSDTNTLQRIFKNALEHFSRFGYAGASVREITHASRVTKPTLYYYFKNKEDLYKKLTEYCYGEILQNFEASIAGTGTTYERVLKLINGYSLFCAEKTAIVRFVHQIILSEEHRGPGVGAAEFSQKIRNHFSTLVEAGAAAGEVPADKVEGTTYAILGIFNLRIETLMMDWLTPSSPSVVEEAVGVVLRPTT